MKKTACLELIPDGYFLAVAWTIGSSEKELQALRSDKGGKLGKRREHLAFVMHNAMHQLADVEPEGHG